MLKFLVAKKCDISYKENSDASIQIYHNSIKKLVSNYHKDIVLSPSNEFTVNDKDNLNFKLRLNPNLDIEIQLNGLWKRISNIDKEEFISRVIRYTKIENGEIKNDNLELIYKLDSPFISFASNDMPDWKDIKLNTTKYITRSCYKKTKTPVIGGVYDLDSEDYPAVYIGEYLYGDIKRGNTIHKPIIPADLGKVWIFVRKESITEQNISDIFKNRVFGLEKNDMFLVKTSAKLIDLGENVPLVSDLGDNINSIKDSLIQNSIRGGISKKGVLFNEYRKNFSEQLFTALHLFSPSCITFTPNQETLDCIKNLMISNILIENIAHLYNDAASGTIDWRNCCSGYIVAYARWIYDMLTYIIPNADVFIESCRIEAENICKQSSEKVKNRDFKYYSEVIPDFATDYSCRYIQIDSVNKEFEIYSPELSFTPENGFVYETLTSIAKKILDGDYSYVTCDDNAFPEKQITLKDLIKYHEDEFGTPLEKNKDAVEDIMSRKVFNFSVVII